MNLGLLGSIGRGIKGAVVGAGRGLLDGLDRSAMSALTSGGLLDSALGQDGQPFTPTPQQKGAMRTQYLQGIFGAMQQGRPVGEGIQDYQQRGIQQIQGAQQAQQQNKARDMRASFQSELQAATTPEAQRSVMVKWAPFFPKEVQDLAGAIKATKPDVLTIKETNTYTGQDGKPVLVDTFSDGSRRPVVGYTPTTQVTWVDIGGAKLPLDQQGNRIVGLPELKKTQTPGEEQQAKQVRQLPTSQGYVNIDQTGTTVTPVVGQDGKQVQPYQAPKDNSVRDMAMGNQSYNFHTRELDTIAKPITDALARSSRLIETLNNGSPTALAAAVPEFLTVMAGGAGSGLRMTNAEIAAIVGSRSVWDDIVAKASKFSTDPQKYPLTPTQVKNIRDMATAVTNKMLQKQQLINEGYQAILSPNIMDHKQGVMRVRQGIANIDMGGGGKKPSLSDIFK